MQSIHNVLVTGGAGYVGSALVPRMLDAGYAVTVLDLLIYGVEPLASVAAHPKLTLVKGDIRDRRLLERVMPGIEAVIHLACISNDPSFELNPDLGKSINFDAFHELVDVAKDCGVRRFVYASSSSVYGIKNELEVTENLSLEPLTDYSKYKAMCEDVLLAKRSKDFATLILRPATVCGYAPRQRLDLTVNILTNHAVNNRRITVFGGPQTRPNIHIGDMVGVYLKSLEWDDELIDGEIFNVGYENHAVAEIAEKVRGVIGGGVDIITSPTDDNRSYRISSDKIRRALGFMPTHSIEDAIQDLSAAFKTGKLPDSMTASRYFNIKRMQEIDLK